MRTTIKGLFAITALLFAGSSMAEVITPDFNPDTTPCAYSGADQNCWAVDDDSNAGQPDLDELADLVGIDGEVLFYKDETDGKDKDTGAINPGMEEGSFAADYTTTWNPGESDPSGATITWNGGNFVTCPECFLWVKDGQSSPNLYVFDIGWWNGRTELTLANFWVPVLDPATEEYTRGNGAISNIGIFGRRIEVPEPGTLGLLGIAALGVGLVRRRKI